MTLAKGQIYESRYRVQYQVIALWENFAWVHVVKGFAGTTSKMPETMHRNFFEQEGMKLLDVPKAGE